MFRACFVLLLVANLALAADKPKKAPRAAVKPVGTWERDVSGVKFTFTFKADNTATMKATSGELNVAVQGHYGVTPGGTLFGIMTVATAKGARDSGPEKGDLFSFRYSINKGEMTLSDLKGTKITDEARKYVEGVYTKKEK